MQYPTKPLARSVIRVEATSLEENKAMTRRQIKELETIIGKLEALQQGIADFQIRDLVGIGKKALIVALNQTSNLSR